jgi:mRNA-degrading endonuclease RelE of RelBE toxin-antitoxin system
MAYRIRYSDEAKRTIPDIPGNYRQRIRRTIEELAAEPLPAEAIELERELVGLFKIKIERWCIIYTFNEDAGIVFIIGIRLKTGPQTYEDLHW